MKKFLILFTCLTLLQGRVMATGDEHVEPIPLGVTVIDLITPPIGKGKAPMCIPRIYEDDYTLILLGFHPENLINIVQNDKVVYTSIIPEGVDKFELPAYIVGECTIQFINGRFCFTGYIQL